MRRIIVGSAAIKRNLPHFREPKDIDYWQDEECKITSGDYKVIPTHILDQIFAARGYASLDDVYTIKCSHLGWNNPMWNKHKVDILHLKSFGARIKEPLYDDLLEFWKKELGNKDFLSLKQDKKGFFTDGVVYKYDHDYLHELVAFPNKPVYTKCLKEGEEILIDMNKFFDMPFEQQIRMFKEEITVIALERWVIPLGVSWYKAYFNALQRTITNLTKGGATDFLIRNIDLFNKPDYSLFEYSLQTLIK